MDFAKIYRTKRGQLLAMKDTNEDFCPCIKLYAEPEGLGVCCLTLSFDDTDEGSRRLDKAFYQLTKEQAVAHAAPLFEFPPTTTE